MLPLNVQPVSAAKPDESAPSAAQRDTPKLTEVVLAMLGITAPHALSHPPLADEPGTRSTRAEP
ncbi:MAG TPA: hypothetical protein VGD69_00330 [Herpetosiphonaceae bacterium]